MEHPNLTRSPGLIKSLRSILGRVTRPSRHRAQMKMSLLCVLSKNIGGWCTMPRTRTEAILQKTELFMSARSSHRSPVSYRVKAYTPGYTGPSSAFGDWVYRCITPDSDQDLGRTIWASKSLANDGRSPRSGVVKGQKTESGWA